ncbi:MAG: FAD-dependent oxidoreductase [Xanthomonadales bacterium]|jgi:predicted NAD/FAD-binding protein|nr:FAD-dependent oxidoreductase [Xanthomonadales bacterium]
MKIAIVGTGIAGNYAAYRLARDHEITVFESADRIGGHTNTVEVEDAGRKLAVDTGFIVYNDRTYPNFIALLDELGVATQTSDMGFSVSGGAAGLEYNGSSLNGLFAQRRNLFNPRFYRMLSEILRFNREAPAFLEQEPLDTTLSLGGFLGRKGYSAYFTDYYILPMGSAIWSATPRTMRAMPAAFFFRFFQNHGLLTVNDHPQWRVVKGGSARYLDKLVAGHRDRIRTSAPVREIRRDAAGVEIRAEGCDAERFDRVFLACHSDQALKMLADATPQEREVLGAIPYQRNEAVLHTDTSLMPAQRRAWASWNYNIPGDALRPDGLVTLTYNMNILQSLDASTQYCVTLNNSAAIDPGRVLQTIQYEHPVFTERAVAAQKRHREIDGKRNTYFCGAYWRYGFHEDGVVSAIDALRHFSEDSTGNGHEERNLLRTA